MPDVVLRNVGRNIVEDQGAIKGVRGGRFAGWSSHPFVAVSEPFQTRCIELILLAFVQTRKTRQA